MPKRITPGCTARFTYPDYGTPNNYPAYTAHSGQRVVVLRQLTDPGGEQPLYVIRAEDGWEGHANADELRVVRKIKKG